MPAVILTHVLILPGSAKSSKHFLLETVDKGTDDSNHGKPGDRHDEPDDYIISDYNIKGEMECAPVMNGCGPDGKLLPTGGLLLEERIKEVELETERKKKEGGASESGGDYSVSGGDSVGGLESISLGGGRGGVVGVPGGMMAEGD